MTFSSPQTIAQVTLSNVFTDMAVDTSGQIYGVIYSGVSDGSSSFNVLQELHKYLKHLGMMMVAVELIGKLHMMYVLSLIPLLLLAVQIFL